MESLKHNYKKEMYDKIKEYGYNFAEQIIPILQQKFKIKTVLDVGCGNGSFLLKCLDFKFHIRGYDGRHVKNLLLIPQGKFTIKDLRRKFEVKNKYDLTLSLEVAEHLHEEYKDNFIDSICNSSNLILFSAAQIGQSGIHHVNCQRLEYWIDEFNKRGFIHDINITDNIRNMDIHIWYKKNAMVFYKI